MSRRAIVLAWCLGFMTAAVSHAEPARIAQRWASSGIAYAETDSLAACRLADGAVRVYATAKDGNRIDVFDAATGRHVQSFGETGSATGQLAYPNGIIVATLDGRPFVLVVERDNHRVQAFRADSGEPAGVLGSDELHRPYGCALSLAGDAPLLFVTDTEVPAGETVNVFKLSLDGSALRGALVRSFGDSDGDGRIRTAESIAVDDRHGHVLLCDEHESARDVKVYTLDGAFTGRSFGRSDVVREPEGIAIVDSPGSGVIILTDQQKALSVWHLYDRRTFAHLASCTGEPTIANTDGICVLAEPFGPFAGGAMFAVHDDAEVRAYALEDIVALAPRPR